MARDKEGQVDKQAPTISLPPSHKHQLDLHATHAFSRRAFRIENASHVWYIKGDADHYHVRCTRLAQLAFFSSLSCAFRRRRRAAAGGPVGHARSLPPKPLNPSGLPSYCRLAAKGFFSLPLRRLKPESKKVPPRILRRSSPCLDYPIAAKGLLGVPSPTQCMSRYGFYRQQRS